MFFVIDTNVLISALIKNSYSRAIITLSRHKFFYPKLAVEEVHKYKAYIIAKSKLSEEEYQLNFDKLFKRINLVSQNKIEPFLQEAKSIMERIDPKDVIFIATALFLEDANIWSEDKHFDKQDRIKIWKTKDLINLFEN